MSEVTQISLAQKRELSLTQISHAQQSNLAICAPCTNEGEREVHKAVFRSINYFQEGLKRS